MNRSMKRKAAQTRRNALLVAALMLVVCIASIGGTIAWLTDKTDPVNNTFSPADIGISLTETLQSDGTNRGEAEWTAQLVPGVEYTKNPVVAVEAETDVSIYLFVKVEENDCDTYLDYTLAWDYESTGEGDEKAPLYSGWKQLTGEGVTGKVYWRIVEVSDTVKAWHLLVDDKVTVDAKLLKKGSTSTNNEPVMPDGNQTMSFTAYAIQQQQFATPLAAWKQVKTLT